MTEAWLRGPIEGVPFPLQPVAHALTDALEELERAAAGLDTAALWTEPGGAASIGFHLRHVCGSLDRLLTYAEAEALTDVQLAFLRGEAEPGEPPTTADALLSDVRTSIGSAIDRLRRIRPETLADPRPVGRAGLPSTVQGLLFHAAEHTRRHAGQVIATAKVVRAGAGVDPDAAREAYLAAATAAWEDAGVRGLCGEGRFEVAMDALKRTRPAG